jgi:hypothetical protein
MNWFYESAGQQQGPVTEQDLDRLLAEGRITPETLVWREGLADWQPLRLARPGGVVPPIGLTGDLPPGHVRCSLTGKIIPESEAIYIQGKPYSAEAKPQVLHSLQAGGTLPASDDSRTGPAWERRQELGLVTAAWETIKAVITQPSETFSTMRRVGGLGNPLTFYLLVGSAGSIFTQICIYLITATGAVESTNPMMQGQPTTVGQLLLQILLVPLYIVLGAFIHSAITHVSLMILGGAKQPYETTFRVLSYGNGGVAALFFIPVCGWVIGAIWGIVVNCIGLARAHEINTGRAVLAVFLPAIVCCLLIFIIGFGLGLLGAAAQSGGLPQ